MSRVYIPAGTATTTGDSANVKFYSASTGGRRIRDIYTVGTDGAPSVLVPNGVVVIGSTSGAYGPYVADTTEHKIYFEDTTGTRTLVATNYAPFRVLAGTATTKNASTTLSNTGITFNGVASAVYRVQVTADITATSGTPDAKFQWGLPSGASAVTWKLPDLGVGAAGTAVAGVADNADLVVGTLNGTTRVILVADITISTTAGAVTLKFAQNTSDASNTVFAATSSALVDRIS